MVEVDKIYKFVEKAPPVCLAELRPVSLFAVPMSCQHRCVDILDTGRSNLGYRVACGRIDVNKSSAIGGLPKAAVDIEPRLRIVRQRSHSSQPQRLNDG